MHGYMTPDTFMLRFVEIIIPGVSKKYDVPYQIINILRMVQYNNIAIFWDMASATFIKVCVKFQPYTVKVAKVMNVREMMDQMGLG